MKYSETGTFSAYQEQLAEKIAKSIELLKDSGCTILVKADKVCVYKTQDIEHAQSLYVQCGCDYSHPLKCIDAGHVDDSGADDIEHFEGGYINEE